VKQALEDLAAQSQKYIDDENSMSLLNDYLEYYLNIIEGFSSSCYWY
jgi:hypothetical protein